MTRAQDPDVEIAADAAATEQRFRRARCVCRRSPVVGQGSGVAGR